jgi:hypothetical protein
MQGLAGRQANLLGVSPEFFERIVFANVFQKDVHDHIAEIHENPFRGRRAFDAERPMALLGEDAVDMSGNCPSLAL